MDRFEQPRLADHTSETPETPRPAIAPLRFRLAAMVYDALVVLALWVLTVVVLVTVVGDAVVGAWVQSLLFVECYALLAFCWCRRGQTLGMAAWRLRLLSGAPPEPTAGGPVLRIESRITPAQALARFAAGLASFATLGLGFCWMWFDRDRKSWPDRFSHSLMVREPACKRRR